MAFDRKILKAVAFDRHLFNNTNSTCSQVGGGQGFPLLMEQKFMTPLGVLTPPGHVNKMQHLVLVHRGGQGVPLPLEQKFITLPGGVYPSWTCRSNATLLKWLSIKCNAYNSGVYQMHHHMKVSIKSYSR